MRRCTLCAGRIRRKSRLCAKCHRALTPQKPRLAHLRRVQALLGAA